MTRIGLVSDSHGHLDYLKKAVEGMGEVDLIIHTGDYVEDADEIRHWTSTPVMAVKGNMDRYVEDKPEFIKTNIEGHDVYIAHGHREQVKWDTNRLVDEAKRRGCDIAFFGHTHRRELTRSGGVVLVNAGSCAIPNDGEKSYAVVDIDGDRIDCKFYAVET